MARIGIKEFKAGLSRYIERVTKGEEIIITEDGREIAMLTPVSTERQVIKSLMKNKRASWNGGKPSGVKGIRIKGKSLTETILEDRE